MPTTVYDMPTTPTPCADRALRLDPLAALLVLAGQIHNADPADVPRAGRPGQPARHRARRPNPTPTASPRSTPMAPRPRSCGCASKGTVNLSSPRAIFAGSPPRFTRSRVTYEAYVVSGTSTRPQVDSAALTEHSPGFRWTVDPIVVSKTTFLECFTRRDTTQAGTAEVR